MDHKILYRLFADEIFYKSWRQAAQKEKNVILQSYLTIEVATIEWVRRPPDPSFEFMRCLMECGSFFLGADEYFLFKSANSRRQDCR